MRGQITKLCFEKDLIHNGEHLDGLYTREAIYIDASKPFIVKSYALLHEVVHWTVAVIVLHNIRAFRKITDIVDGYLELIPI